MSTQVTAAIVAIVVIIPLLSFGLWNSEPPIIIEKAEGQSKIAAITSFYPLYEFTKEIGGDKVDASQKIYRSHQKMPIASMYCIQKHIFGEKLELDLQYWDLDSG